MLSSEYVSVHKDIPTKTFRKTAPLVTVESSSQTGSNDQSSIKAEISSETTTIGYLSIDDDMSSQFSGRRQRSVSLEPPPDAISDAISLADSQTLSETITQKNLSTNHGASSKTSPVKTILNESHPFLKTYSFKQPSIDNERSFKAMRNNHLSVNLEIPSDTLSRQASSVDLEGLPQLFKSISSIFTVRTPSIRSKSQAEAENKGHDAALMEQMGYTQELKRGFSGLMSFTFCFTVVSVFPSISIGLDFGLATGGSGVLVWSWIIGSVFNILVGLSLSEICSTYPNSGSVYYWSGQLAPKRIAPLAAYACGWCSYFGNVGGTAAFASGFASIINAAVALGTDRGNDTSGINDVPHELTLNNRIQASIAIGIIIIWTLHNALKIDQQGWINNLAAFIQTTSTIAIIIAILVLSDNRTSVYDVFIETYNSTGFNFAYVCCIGILPTLFSFSGFESAGHLTEETRDADRKAPIAITGTCISAALIGFIFLLALLFACGDPIGLVNNQLNPSATVQIFQTTTPFPVALLFTILLIICLYFAGVSATTVSSRTGYAMARDSIFPYSNILTKIYKRTQTPLTSVILVGILNILLLLLQLVSSTAFAAIVSISTIGFQISYLIPIVFRCTTARKTFKKGRINLGQFGVPIGIISSLWLFITSVILLFPFNYPITAENMNWTLVVCSGITIFAGLYWIFGVRHWYSGPPRLDNTETTVVENRF